MPLFEYECPDCGYVFEKLVLSRKAEAPDCPKCGNQAEQIFSAFATASGKGASPGTACAPSGGG